MINVDSRLLDRESADRLDADEIYLLMQLTKRINRENTCWPSIKTVAADSGWSEDKTKQVRSRLFEKGLLKELRKGSGRRSTLYKVTCDWIGVYLGGGKKSSPSILSSSEGGKIATSAHRDSPPSAGEETAPEVLGIEVLDNDLLTTEELEIAPILFIHSKINRCLFQGISRDATDKTSKVLNKKIETAAREILDFFKTNPKPAIPTYRIGMFSSGEFCPHIESVDQVKAYSDWTRLTDTWRVRDPEKLAEKIVSQDWCESLLRHSEKNYPDKYDPIDDFELYSDWLVEHFYESGIAYIDRRNSNRLILR